MFSSGQQIGNYSLVRKLGKGGFGEVWLAEKSSQFFTKKVAVKLPLDDQVNFDTIRREAQLWEEASGHPNVLPIIDAEVYDGQVVIVSEYADGGSLADRIKNEGKFTLEQAVEMTAGILSGLEFLHSRNIVHRDIKPANILLQGDTPRLADFGISRAMNTSTISSVVVGTDSYMAPEAFDGKRNVQTDIWSVGVVLYQLLKGSLPFPQEHPSERMFAVLTKEFQPLPDEIPLGLKRIVQKALVKDPADRYQSAREMRNELKNYLSAPTQQEQQQSPPNTNPHDQRTAVLPKSAAPTQQSNAPSTSGDSDASVPPPDYFVPPSPPQSAGSDTNNQSVVTKFHVTPAAPTKPDYLGNAARFAQVEKNKSKLSSYELLAITLVGGLIIVGIFVFVAILDRGKGLSNTTSNYNPANIYTNTNMTMNTANGYRSNTTSNASAYSSNYYSSNKPASNYSSGNTMSNYYSANTVSNAANVPYYGNRLSNAQYYSANANK